MKQSMIARKTCRKRNFEMIFGFMYRQERSMKILMNFTKNIRVGSEFLEEMVSLS